MNASTRLLRGEALRLLAIVVAAVFALAQSWERWLDPIIDVGRDLYIPEQILRGAKLYADIRYNYPPLAPYLLASITGILGSSLHTYAWIGIGQSVAIAVVLWLTSNQVGGRWAAFATTLAFVSINMCGASTYGANFIFPYSYAATFGTLFLLGHVAALVFERPGLAIVMGVLAAWSKQEFAIAVVLVMAAAVIVKKLSARHVAFFVLSLAASVIAGAWYFGYENLRANVFPQSLLDSARADRFYAWVSGTSHWRQNLAEASMGLVAILAAAWLLRRNRRAAIAVAAIAGVLLPVSSFFRAAGVLQWTTLLRRRDVWLFVAGAASIAATLRIAFNVAPAWYGFALTVPLYVLAARWIRGEMVWVALIVVLSLRSLADQRSRFELRSFPVDSPRGRFFDHNPDRAAVLGEAIPILLGKSVVIIPEGLGVNYFSRSTTPLSYQTFTPVETAGREVEAAILEELQMKQPERIVLLTRDVSEFGSRGFGVDYNQRVLAFVRSNYRVERAWKRPRFELVLLVRKPVVS